MSDQATVREACAKLDPGNDAHWTSQGLPRMDALASLGLTIDRRELNEAYPGFTRATLAKDRESAPVPVIVAAPASEAVDSAKISHQHIVARHDRHRRAVEIASKALEAAGLSLSDLTRPVRCKADLNIAARNRAARRAS